MIPFATPSIGKEETDAVIAVLNSKWLTMGKKVFEFEEMLAKFTGAKHVITVNSCTAALHLSLLAYGIGKGDEVITTPYTFAATGNSIIHAGATPVFVDVGRDFNINPENIEDAITPRTKAIIPVDFAGQPCDYSSIIGLADEYDLVVIEDAAHSLGAEHCHMKIGSVANATCFSFYATKCITTGEGGAIATDDDKIAETIRKLRLHGLSSDAWKRYSGVGKWYYEIEEIGWKYNMTDINAAIGIEQLKKEERFYQRRVDIAEHYTKGLQGCKCGLPTENPNTSSAWHLYPILVNNRNDVINQLAQLEIGTSVHFIPLHHHPAYQRLGYSESDFPVATSLYEHEISLPIYPGMTDEQVQMVITALREILA